MHFPFKKWGMDITTKPCCPWLTPPWINDKWSLCDHCSNLPRPLFPKCWPQTQSIISNRTKGLYFYYKNYHGNEIYDDKNPVTTAVGNQNSAAFTYGGNHPFIIKPQATQGVRWQASVNLAYNIRTIRHFSKPRTEAQWVRIKLNKSVSPPLGCEEVLCFLQPRAQNCL